MLRRGISSIFAALICAIPLAALAQTPPAQGTEQPNTAGASVAAPAAPAPAPKSELKFEFHGFVGGSLFMQDAQFNGYGEQVNHVVRQPKQDKLTFGGDARQTRLTFSLAGPKVFGGATPKAVAEIDFFSALNGGTTAPPVTGVIAVAPRLRLAYAELNWGATIIRFGNDTDLITTFSPASVGHLPQSFGYSAGLLGTRHMVFDVFQTIPVGALKLELAGQAQNPTHNAADGDPFVQNVSRAESSGIPAFEARARVLSPGLFEVYAAGHWGSVDRNGADATIPASASPAASRFGESLNVVIGDVGAKVTMGPLTVQGQAYAGKNVQSEAAPTILAAVPVAPSAAAPRAGGDVHEWGAWGQVGFNLTPEFSAWGFIGTEKLNYAEAIANYAGAAGTGARLQNVTTAGMLRYMDGGYALALEYVHMHTKYSGKGPSAGTAAQPGPAPNGVLDGNQLMLSGYYFF